MAIRVALHHKTHYQFDRPLGVSPHIVRLRPAVHCRTPIVAYSLKITPKEHFLNWQQDPFGNYLARLVFPEKVKELGIEVDLLAEMTTINPFDFFLEHDCEHYPFTYSPGLLKELTPYLEVRENGPLLTEWLQQISLERRRTVDFLVGVNQQVQRDIKYGVRLEPGVQSCEETLRLGKGSCRDSGWLLVQILRHLGLASRFVSGYIVQLTPDIKPLDGPAGAAADFVDLHAWAEVYIPGAGWLGFDPTSGLVAGEGHIPLACTPDPTSASPVTGYTEIGDAKMRFAMNLARIHEDPRVTKPYTEEQWQAIDTLGAQVEEDLQDLDVRLTMGGEPTFVSIDDMDGAEWNTAALGANKWLLGGRLLRRLHSRWAPGGVLHYGQGKWYPGEELPRWALGCFWRTDGEPVWQNPALLAEEDTPTEFGVEAAEAFMRALSKRLVYTAHSVRPAFEDVYYYLWKEGTLPVNVDPFKVNLKDTLERRRLRRLLEQGLDRVTGYVLPLRWAEGGQRTGWETGPWPMRRPRLYLLPGDSPMGYRLPLEGLPFVPPEQRPPQVQPDPLLPPRHSLEAYSAHRQHWFEPGEKPQRPPNSPLAGISSESTNLDMVRTALCIEPRQGRLYVFLPPFTHLEHYLNLIAAIEATAAELSMPVILEGYPPPHDRRLQRVSVTPDPGVLEVNVPPSLNWEELKKRTSELYEEARLSRLGQEKFMVDGRHSGTGGGNHVTLGGPTPADSPILRRPDLLTSLVNFWQHHPGLSYLFSGLFIGPTSQMPRVDEARNDALYELEIAFQQLQQTRPTLPWVVDRAMRHLLVDMTGNTHRAEFCIDKLYSPDSYSGRQGIVEFRGFEMPPHWRMSLVQTLLLRALTAYFWRKPYNKPLVRWGTELHDRFLLPHYVAEDVKNVLDVLREDGYPFVDAWFDPFLEFRFPQYGRVQLGDIGLELRMAIEPWNVLGEEVRSSGTTRYVDSSVERLQVRAVGLTDGRHIVTCNGRRLPLHATGTHGVYVAGVRYKAWQPTSGLHPTIGVHAPLVFDVMDSWNNRSLGGCTYHVSNPGGLAHERFPVNALEAESRRIARFWAHGYTPGTMRVPAEEPNREFPYTLDLRRAVQARG